jgi:mannose-6-phosphate isomerase-like protein (cupin superfamily)
MTQASTEAPARAAVARHGEGEARWWLGGLAEIKAGAADTGGGMTVVEVTEPPGMEAPLHVHYREDEAFWILEGTATFEVGGTRFDAGPGDFAFGPRGVPHRYTVGESGCRMLFILTPGGFEDLVRGMSTPARERTLPPADEPVPGPERIQEVAQRYGCSLVDA